MTTIRRLKSEGLSILLVEQESETRLRSRRQYRYPQQRPRRRGRSRRRFGGGEPAESSSSISVSSDPAAQRFVCSIPVCPHRRIPRRSSRPCAHRPTQRDGRHPLSRHDARGGGADQGSSRSDARSGAELCQSGDARGQSQARRDRSDPAHLGRATAQRYGSHGHRHSGGVAVADLSITGPSPSSAREMRAA